MSGGWTTSRERAETLMPTDSGAWARARSIWSAASVISRRTAGLSTQSSASRAIAERLFNQLPHQRFLLEYDSPRAGSFAPLRFVPKGKIVVLGLVSTKVPQLENKSDLRRRIDEAARYIPLEQLAVSPQCGFGSDVVGNLVSAGDQKRKLERVVELAREVWT